MDRRNFVKRGAVAVAASAVGCAGYAIGIEPHWLEIVQRDLPIDHLPPSLEGKRLAQVSDVHIGPSVSDDYIIESFNRLRAAAPDIVVLTGDFITYRQSGFDQLRAVLTHFPHGTLATLGILGNHDYGRNWSEPGVATKVVAEAERAGLRVLRNESANVAGLDIVGVDDLWARAGNPERALQSRGADAALVLVHNPDAADELRRPGYRGLDARRPHPRRPVQAALSAAALAPGS